MTANSSAPARAVSTRAVATFAAGIESGDFLFPSVDTEGLVLGPDSSHLPIYLFDEETAQIGADNRFVSIHADGKAGPLFQGARLLFQVGMEPIPGTFIAAMHWKRSGSFRLGYRLTPEAKRRSEDARLILIHRCLVALAAATERFVAFNSQFDTSQDRIFGEPPEAD